MEVSLVARANERRQAVRALFESGAVDIGLLSAASGYAVSSIERRILREGWVTRVREDIDDRLARLAESLVGQVETLRLENEGSFDKGQVDMVGSIVRTVEKISELMRGGDRAKVSQTNRDAEMADVLARINRRIIELARDYARVLVAGESDRA